MTPKTRTRVRSRSSWIGAIALSLTVAIGAVGCSPDTLAQSTKAVGDESSVDASEIPQAPDPATIEPMSSATSSTEAGGEISTTRDVGAELRQPGQGLHGHSGARPELLVARLRCGLLG